MLVPSMLEPCVQPVSQVFMWFFGTFVGFGEFGEGRVLPRQGFYCLVLRG